MNWGSLHRFSSEGKDSGLQQARFNIQGIKASTTITLLLVSLLDR